MPAPYGEGMWDVLIVGGGPAGCAAAASVLQRRPKASVLIVDKAEFPRDKPCGDAVAGAALRVLNRLELDPGPLVSGYPASDRLWLRSPGAVAVARLVRDPMHVVPRRVFDARLLAAVCARGATLRQYTVRRLRVLPDRVVLNDELQARAVVAADGAESTVRRCLGASANPPGRVAVAIRGYGAQLTGQDGAPMISMTREHWPAYAWSFPLPDGTANIGYGEVLTGRPLTRAALLRRLEAILPDGVPRPQTLRAHRLPLSTWRPRIRTGRVLLTGDAQSMINPFTGEGIYYAVLTGALAGAAAVHGAAAGDLYRNLLRHRLGRHLRHTSLLAGLGSSPALIDALTRGAAADQRVFDDLLPLGLADGWITGRIAAAAVHPANWLPAKPSGPAADPAPQGMRTHAR
jgi:menaquinone-9 beta-reductase